MKTILITLSFFLCLNQLIHAQCNFTIPANVITIDTQNTVYYNDGNINPEVSFLVCQDISLTLKPKGTQIVHVYLEPYAVLNFNDDSFFVALVDVYAKDFTQINYAVSNMQSAVHIDTVRYTSSAMQTNTANNPGPNIQIPCAAINYNYSLLPFGKSPCTKWPLSTTDQVVQNQATVTNTGLNSLDIRFNQQPTDIEFVLYNTLGQQLLSQSLDHAYTHIDLASLPTGLLIYSIRNRQTQIQAGKIVH